MFKLIVCFAFLLWGSTLQALEIFTCEPEWGSLAQEIGKDKVAMVQALISSVSSSFEPVTLKGQEIDLILSKDEALFEAHALHQDNEDILAYQDDELMLEENDLSSGCGFEDFVDLINSWHEFSAGR